MYFFGVLWLPFWSSPPIGVLQGPLPSAPVPVSCQTTAFTESPRHCVGEALRAMRSKLTAPIRPLGRAFLAVPPSLGSVLWRSPIGSFLAHSPSPTSAPGFPLWSMAAGVWAKPLPAITLDPLSSPAAIAQSPLACTPVVNRSAAPTRQLIQVRLGDRPIFQVPNGTWVRGIVRRLKQAIQDPEFDAEQIQPAQVNGQPAIKMGDRVLLTVTPEIVQDWTCNAEQLSLHWINRLRLAFGKVPLDLALAQEALYNLREGARRLQLSASWYGPNFHGRQTATGEIFDQQHFTAAHPFLPFDTYLKVTNQNNGKSVIVRVNDRGPYVGDRDLDLSWEAARAIGSESDGVVPLDAVIMEPALSLQPTALAIASALP